MRNEKDILELDARSLSKEIHSKKVSCCEVMEAYLNQIEAINPVVNAVVSLRDHGELLKDAKAKDNALAAGIDEGWMHGFPQAIKDLEATKGIPSTYGSPILKNYIPEFDGLLVQRMKDAGSIIIGKTNTPEWGYGSQTYNEVYGTTGNPYDPSVTSGGSSGGAACSVALHMQVVADGSDYMGSLRNPAGYCNIYGYRPSWGRVPSPGFDFFLQNCGVSGPMARNVSDLALLLATQSGYYAPIPSSLEDDSELKSLTPDNVDEKLSTNVSGRKIAWLGNWNGYLEIEDGILDLCISALKKFSAAGVSFEEIDPPSDPEKFWNDVWLPTRHLGAFSLKGHYDNPETRKLLKPEAIFEYEGLLNYSALELSLSSIKRTEWFTAIMKVFETYDYIAVPTAQVFAFDKNIHWPKEINGKKMDIYNRWMEIVTHWTVTGLPVAAIPAGLNDKGQSIGIQVIGKPRSDYDLLQFAHAYEQINDVVNTFRPALLDT
ncbi:MAG: amidase [Lachnospiraceae bacterium]